MKTGILFDLDGTLLDTLEDLWASTNFALSSMGYPRRTLEEVRQFVGNGAGRLIARAVPEDAVCAQVRDIVRECRMQVLYEAREGAIYTDGAFSLHPRATEEAQRMAEKGFTVAELDTLPEPRFMKLVTFDGPDSCRDAFIRRVSPWYDITDRGNTMLELVLKGCSKAGGMLELLDHLGLSRKQTLAIGDSTNDLPMFRVAAHGICLGGGMEQLKQAADYVTAPVLEDGLYKGLAHYGLL